jgi:hypothetical protein
MFGPRSAVETGTAPAPVPAPPVVVVALAEAPEPVGRPLRAVVFVGRMLPPVAVTGATDTLVTVPAPVLVLVEPAGTLAMLTGMLTAGVPAPGAATGYAPGRRLP